MVFGTNGGERRIRRELQKETKLGGFHQNALYTHIKFTNNLNGSSRLLSVSIAVQNQWLSFYVMGSNS